MTEEGENLRKGRTTVYNQITSPIKLESVNRNNIELGKDFLNYLKSVGRAQSTIEQYSANLNIFWCWNLEHNHDKFFVDLTKRDIIKLQHYCLEEFNWSPKRLRTFKATLSSLSNYIENILDDEYPTYRPIINKIESPPNETVREKTVLTDEEVQTILDYLIDHEEYEKAVFLSLGVNSGRRKAELARFKMSFFMDRNLIANGALYKSPEKIRTKGRGRKGKMLYVYTIAKPFKPYFDLWKAQRQKLGIKSEWLFPKRNLPEGIDEPREVSTFDNWSEQFSNIIGKPVYPHCLRHKFVSDLAANNIPNNIIKDIVGWSDISMVDIYNDQDTEETFDKYFDEDGIKTIASNSIDNM